MANSPKRRRRKGFLEDFRLADAYLLKPERTKGRPGIFEGTTLLGDPVLVKVWPRVQKVDDTDLQEIWRHELRQLHRLSGYPDASDNIASLYQVGMDETGFYLVLDPGLRRPLHSVLESSPGNHWLKQPRSPAVRGRIWRNLRRIAVALDCLHAQGLLHRNLDTWAILTTGGEETDFQLTGFEWSMRLMAAADASFTRRKVRDLDSEFDSFANDWAMFGLVAAELLGVPTSRLFDSVFPAGEVAEHLGADEVRLLRNLLGVEVLLRLDGDVVTEKIDEVTASLAAEVANLEPKLHLVARVGSGTPLADKIVAMTGNDIDGSDDEKQLEFIRSDLSSEALLIAVKLQDSPNDFRMVLRGHNVYYTLQQYSHLRSRGGPSWEFAFVSGVEKAPPAPTNVIGHLPLQASSIDVLSVSEAADRFPRMRGRLRTWEELKNKLKGEHSVLSDLEQFHRALVLTQFLDTLYGAADVFPVEVVKPTSSQEQTDGDETLLRLRLRRDEGRDELSKALDLRAPATRLNDALTTDRVRSEGWFLTESRVLGERSPTDTEWKFDRVEEGVNTPPVYVFKGPSPVPYLREAYLIPEDSVGRDAQFRRRLKALRALKDHSELLRMLVRPRARVLDSHDQVKEGEAFQDLDPPKQQAFREALSTIPFYLVQGPPGVGKTRLVRDLVQDRFREDQTTRLLLTAQSNHAVDHLMGELADALQANDSPPLVVRCRARESTRETSAFDIGIQAEQLLSKLASSKLAAQATPAVRETLSRLSTQQNGKGANGKRTFEGLVMRAANVVFATTNSADLERLIDERGQFDWAIVEEAGKATGCELVSPLLLSHRRLMIGDHKQLPPFGSDEILKLLEGPEQVRRALEAGAEYVGRALKDADTEEVLDEIDEGTTELAPLCALAMRALMLFETLIEDELKRMERSQSGRPIAKQLTAQHRMHPAIAKIVSRTFYGRKLSTDPSAIKRFAAPSPVRSRDSKCLPDTSIVMIDTPYLQSCVGKRVGEQLPRWQNVEEVGAVIDILKLLEADKTEKKSPSLVVLSPYSRQVKLLENAIEEEEGLGRLNLSGFRKATRSNVYCATVDSFQGNEADVVVVSFVRNNSHVAVKKALGFLSDARRMNVLLSRAKWKLILVGSREFLDTVINAKASPEDSKSLDFLREFLRGLDDGVKAGEASVRTLNELRSGCK